MGLHTSHWRARLLSLTGAAAMIAAASLVPAQAAQPGDQANTGARPGTVPGTVTVRVVVVRLRNDKGRVYCKLHRRSATYPSGKHPSVRNARARPAGRRAVCSFAGVRPGRYAAVIAHDENGNGRVDTNLIGIPKEGYGFSNNVKPFLSAPSFSSAGFAVTRDTTVTIRVIYR